MIESTHTSLGMFGKKSDMAKSIGSAVFPNCTQWREEDNGQNTVIVLGGERAVTYPATNG